LVYAWWVVGVYVGVAAYSEEPDKQLVEKSYLFLGELRSRCGDVRLVVGGYWGLMRYVVILPPVEREHVVFPERAIVIRTGLTFRARSVSLARTSDVLVVLGGGAGSLQELVTAHAEGKPVHVLTNTGYPADVVETWPEYLDDRMLAPLKKVRDPVELARQACDELRRRGYQG
jgi:predicted Rossmann-fold nucleotide-binding protein